MHLQPKHRTYSFVCLLFLLALIRPALAEPPTVLVSIKPIHSLVSSVMQGVGEPDLLIPGGQSPHTFNLRPSDIRKLSTAKLIVWVGEDFETPLQSILISVPEHTRVIGLMDQPALKHLPIRKGGSWESGHSNDATDIHAHQHASDPHLWLSPSNAKTIVELVEAQLIVIDPEHQAEYRENAQKTLSDLDALDIELRASLSRVHEIPYMVFHDAYQYFEQEYDLNAIGSIVVSPERQPGARRIHEVREKLHRLEARCIFTEPQFPPKMLIILTAGSHVKNGTLDPIGADLPAGPDTYFRLLRGLAANLAECLGERS